VLAVVAVRLLNTKLLARSRPEGGEAKIMTRYGAVVYLGCITRLAFASLLRPINPNQLSCQRGFGCDSRVNAPCQLREVQVLRAGYDPGVCRSVPMEPDEIPTVQRQDCAGQFGRAPEDFRVRPLQPGLPVLLNR